MTEFSRRDKADGCPRAFTSCPAERKNNSNRWQSEDYPGFDVIAKVLPKAQLRKMKTFCWYEDVFRPDLPGIDRMQEVVAG